MTTSEILSLIKLYTRYISLHHARVLLRVWEGKNAYTPFLNYIEAVLILRVGAKSRGELELGFQCELILDFLLNSINSDFMQNGLKKSSLLIQYFEINCIDDWLKMVKKFVLLFKKQLDVSADDAFLVSQWMNQVTIGKLTQKLWHLTTLRLVRKSDFISQLYTMTASLNWRKKLEFFDVLHSSQLTLGHSCRGVPTFARSYHDELYF